MELVKYTVDRIAHEFVRFELPEYMWDGLKLYITKGVPPGDFLRNVLENNLIGAVMKADSNNERRIAEWAKIMWSIMPISSRGSVEAVTKWIEAGGLEGIAKQLEESDAETDQRNGEEHQH